MKKNTWIVTMETTIIGDFDRIEPDEDRLKEVLNADDVVITKVQKFEGVEI